MVFFFTFIMSVFYDCILPVHSRSNKVNNENKITQPSARMSGISEDRTVTQTYVIRRRSGQWTGGCPGTFTAWATNCCSITTELVPRSNTIIIILWYTRNSLVMYILMVINLLLHNMKYRILFLYSNIINLNRLFPETNTYSIS